MTYDIDRIVVAIMSADETEVRLSAAAAFEHALRIELKADQADWETLLSQSLPALVHGLGDSHKGIQVHCANCLEILSHHSPQVMTELRKVMAGANAWRAWGAALVAGRLGQWFPELGPALGGAMGARDRDVRWAAANLALALGRQHAEAMMMVKGLLGSDNPTARKMAVYCLGAMGAFADVAGAIEPALHDPDADVRRAAILAFNKLSVIPQTVNLMIAAMRQDPDTFVRRTATAVAAKLDDKSAG